MPSVPIVAALFVVMYFCSEKNPRRPA